MPKFNEDEIVISGISGRYPNSKNPQEFADNLFNAVDMTTDDNPKWPPGKMGVPSKIGCLNNLDKCDAQFFGIIRKHCNSLDPITRQILERTLEAIFDAGLNPLDLKGSNTGVFMSCALLETEMILVQSNEQETYGIMGRNRALNANRLSYWLDLKGPSYSTDCLFNGGLQGIQEAFHAIRSGRIDAAIVGSGSTIIHPQSSYQYDKLKVLSPDGVTRAFDAKANGYARAEAVSIMLLQRAKDAKRCHGTIMHVLNQSMSTTNNILMQPTQDNWSDLYETFYSQCNVDPNNVAYVEADGVANLETDAAELNSIGEYFGSNRSAKNPLLVGSVKSNMGHAEGAANMCAVSKLIVTLKSDTIPPNLHYKVPNPKVKGLVQGKIKVVTEPTPLPGDYVALNSFGLGSTYGHLLLRKNLREKQPVTLAEGSLPYIALVSSRNEEGIGKVLNYIEEVPFDPEYIQLVNNAFRRNLQGHMYRGFTVIPPQEPKVRESRHYSGDKLPVWFVYSGMGSQWPTMARDLLHLPTFRKSISHSCSVLKAHDLDLMHLLTHDDATLLENILHNFVCIVAIQIALTDILRDLGIEPDGIIGHSVGETSASYADGCLTHEQTLLSAYYRGRASNETKVIRGMMAAIGIGYQKIKDQLPEGIQVACRNSADSCTLSGPAQQVEDYVKKLSSEGVFARTVNVANIPYHSKYIQEMGPRMHHYLKHVIPEGKKRSPRWISTSIPESRWSEPSALYCNAEYHINNLLSPVLFEEGSRHIPANAIMIEIAPHGLLQAILKRSLPTCVNIPLTNRNASNQQLVLLKAIGTMYLNGLDPKVGSLYPKVDYPVSRGTGFISPLVTWDHSDNWSNFSSVASDKNDNSRIFHLALDAEDSIYKAHKEDGIAILPYATPILKVLEVFAGSKGKKIEDVVVSFKDVIYHTHLPVQNNNDIRLHVLLQPGSGCFEILNQEEDGNELIVTGIIEEEEKLVPYQEEQLDYSQEVLTQEFYDELSYIGHTYEQPLQTVEKLLIGNRGWKANVRCAKDGEKLLETLLQLKIFQASKATSSLSKVGKIRKLIVNMADLNQEQVEVLFDLDADVVRCGNTEIRGVSLENVPLSPVKYVEEELNSETFTLPLTDNTLKVSHIQFKGKKFEGKQVSFYGSEESPGKIMGVGVADEASGEIKADEALKWTVPKNWGADAAVDVAFNYSLAYYAVHVVGQLSGGQSIAITDGTNKLGLACIRVALQISPQVVTFVTSNQEKLQLLAAQPKLSSENVIVNESKSSEQLCLKLRSHPLKGVNLLINTGEPDITQMVIQCIKPFGIIVEMTDELFDCRGKLKNTYGFLISASLYSCSGNDLTNSPQDIKDEVHGLVEQGIASGIVEPFNQTIGNWRDVKTEQLDRSNKAESTSRFQCDPQKAYLIIGGDPYSWLALAEWFIARKAKNIFVVHKEALLSNSLQKKLNNLQEKSLMMVRGVQKISPELINHIFEVSRSKIALTMLLPLTATEDVQENVVQALCQQDTFLVTILRKESDALQHCEERNSKNKQTLTVVWNEPLNGKTKGFLQTFDRLVSKRINEIVQVDHEKEDAATGIDPYENMLPNSLEDIIRSSISNIKEVKITELQTKSVPFRETKEIAPLFVIPGLTNRNQLIGRLKQALYPVFIIDCPSLTNTALHQYAATIIPKVKAIYDGPYSLCGEGWGGAVALEVAAMLENTGDETRVFLLAASPDELLQNLTQQNLENILLSRIFNIFVEFFDKDSQWIDKLGKCFLAFPAQNEEVAAETINSVKDKALSLLRSYRRLTLNGSVISVSKKNITRSSISWLSRKEVKLAMVGAEEPLLNDKILEMIHTEVLTKTIKK